MFTPVLATKLHVPAVRPEQVARTRLIQQIQSGMDSGSKVTLVCAPAGFGKTTLVAEWIAGFPEADRPSIAWVSLDSADDDTSRFQGYVVSAIQRALAAGTGDESGCNEARTLEDAFGHLINQLADADATVVLVLDDYQVIESRQIHTAVDFLISNAPAGLHVVLTCRADPPLPLARWRARRELTELRAADLRFTSDEAAVFLTDAMQLAVKPADIAALEARTEGWIAGLQLAALSLRGRSNPNEFIRDFSGSSRFVLDYLVEEVLLHQPDDVRDFLLRTAYLDQLSGPLCAAVTGNPRAAELLNRLDRDNVFVVPLDDSRQWYRYHHLFADVLRARMLHDHPGDVPRLHRRAAEWYQAEGRTEEAIDHRLAAGDDSEAADLIEAAIPDIRRTRSDRTLLRWLELLPSAVVDGRPLLATFSAWSLLMSGQFDAAEGKLRQAEASIAAQSAEPERVASVAALPSMIAMYRASLAQARGDWVLTAHYARISLECAESNDRLAQGSAAGFAGLAAWAQGDLVTATDTFTQAIDHLHAAGNYADEVGGALVLGDMWTVRGDLGQARRVYQHGLRLAAGIAGGNPPAIADLHVGMSQLELLQGNIDAAERHLQISSELGELASLLENRHRWFVALAWLRRAQGKADEAMQLLEQAERLYVRGFFPEIRPISTQKAMLLLAEGAFADAERLLRSTCEPGELSYLQEFTQLAWVRLRLARFELTGDSGELADAGRVLDRLREAAEAGGRFGSALEIAVVQALVHDAAGRRVDALAALSYALKLAQPQGQVQVFLENGLPMRKLLAAVSESHNGGRYARQLLAASDPGEAPRAAPSAAPVAKLVDPLSERELEVLRLLQTPLTGPEIARQLFISINTLRTHTKRVFIKLDVTNRRAAVLRAQELGLL